MALSAKQLAERYGVTKSGGSLGGNQVYRIPEVCHGSPNGKRDLAIWDGDGGSLGAKCHSKGCSYQSIHDALGLEFTYEGRTHSYAKTNRTVRRRRGPGKDFDGNTGATKGLYVALVNDSPEKTVVLVEGEKAAEALASYQPPNHTAAYWVGGTGSVTQADYSPLARRDIVLWPDHHKAGREAMEKAAICCRAAGAASLQMISATALDAAQVPIGGDAADLMGNKIDELLASAEEYEPAEALAGGPLTLAGGVAFERHAEGFLSALAALGLELRGNVRSGDAEVKHRHHGTAEALAFEKAAGLDPAPTGWAAFDTKAQEYVKHNWEKHYRYDNGKPYRVSQENFQSWLNAMLASRMRDPVQPWLEGLPPWDGQERIPTMFTDALGAEDSDLHRAAATAFMVGAVRRTYEPGCQHDWAPVLIGDQGTGKSTFCCELLPEGHEGWYAVVSSLAQEIQKQVEAVGSALVVEFKEMRGAARYEAVKSYLDTGVDTFRPPYARTSERHKRRWVGIGTGNDEGQGVLPDDPTGNRRYVAIPVKTPGGTQEERATHVREYMKANRTQLWAEAQSRHWKGEKSYLGGQYEAMRDTQNTAFTRSNQPMEDIAAVLTEKYADSTTGVSLAELMIEAGLANDVADAQDKVKSAGRKLASQLGKRSWERRRVKQRSLWYPPRRVTEAERSEVQSPLRIIYATDELPPGLPRPADLCSQCLQPLPRSR